MMILLASTTTAERTALHASRERMNKNDEPKVVCLCGSTRFKDEYRAENARLTLQGKIVLSVGFFHHAGDTPEGVSDVVEEFEQSGTKADLDELHKRKIDIADWVHVINPDGYIGESTASEIQYALKNDKPVSFYGPEQYPDGKAE